MIKSPSMDARRTMIKSAPNLCIKKTIGNEQEVFTHQENTLLNEI